MVINFSVQLGLFLFSTCHAIVVVLDGNQLQDTKMLKYIQTVRMLQKGIPSVLAPQAIAVSSDVDVTSDKKQQQQDDQILAITSHDHAITQVPEIGTQNILANTF